MARPVREQLEGAEAEQETQEETPAQPNGVLVLRNFNEDGLPSVDIQTLGDVKVTEIETILKMAKNLLDSKFNL